MMGSVRDPLAGDERRTVTRALLVVAGASAVLALP